MTTQPNLVETPLADEALFTLAKSYCAEADGKIRAEHAIATLGAVLGDMILRQMHPEVLGESYLASGQIFISDPVNNILSDDTVEPDYTTPASIWGLTRAVMEKLEVPAPMPEIASLYQVFADGQPQQFGFVPVSVDEDSRPWMMPLRSAYELREEVETVMSERGLNHGEQRAACVLAGARMIVAVMKVLEPAVALRIFLETAWGMAKTVPMTPEALAELENSA